MPHFRFATVGDNCVDRFQPPLSQSLIGGNAINVAVQLALLGHQSFYFGAVGPDVDGDRTRKIIAERGVRVDHLQVRDGNTAYTNIDITFSGDRIFSFEDFGVCQDYVPTEADFAALLTMDHVHIGWIADGGRVRERLAAAGISVSQDVSVNNDPRHLGVEGLTIAFGSAGEDDEVCESMLNGFLSCGVQCAVVTRGHRGSVASTGGQRAETGIAAVDVVDTTGAGDSFIAGFLHGFFNKLNLESCLQAGRDCAAKTCTHVGGFPQEPQPL